MADRRIERKSGISKRIQKMTENAPVGILPVFRRFWGFARDMAKRFNKNLIQNREDELLRAVEKDLKKGL